MFFPFALFLMFKYLKSNNFSWGILLYIMLLVYPVFHPLPSIMLGLILLTLWIPRKLHDLWNMIREKKQNLLNLNEELKGAIPFLFLIIWFIFWYSFYSIWGYTITEVYQTISAEGKPSKGQILTENIQYAQFYGFDVVEIFLKSYGELLLLSILSVLCFSCSGKRFQKSQNRKIFFHYMALLESYASLYRYYFYLIYPLVHSGSFFMYLFWKRFLLHIFIIYNNKESRK